MMDNKLNTVIRVMESLVKLNGWTVVRFDIQAFDHGHGITGYAGYLDIEEDKRRIVIRGDGSFEETGVRRNKAE